MIVEKPLRRVVTGLDLNGRSTVIIDGPAAPVIWKTDCSPADNGGSVDAGGAQFSLAIPLGGTTFFYTDFAPAGEGASIGMHASDTLDYAVVVSGELTLLTQTGETTLHAGDVVVDRGVMHAWRNDGPKSCRVLFVFVKAEPVSR
jgi:quercetin dioxygenase-like cupin family protein